MLNYAVKMDVKMDVKILHPLPKVKLYLSIDSLPCYPENIADALSRPGCLSRAFRRLRKDWLGGAHSNTEGDAHCYFY